MFNVSQSINHDTGIYTALYYWALHVDLSINKSIIVYFTCIRVRIQANTGKSALPNK